MTQFKAGLNLRSRVHSVRWGQSSSYLVRTGPKTNVGAPLEKGDHPEMDASDFLDAEKIKLYQSLIGALQWMVTIGRFDIMTAVVSLSAFRAAPRVGHLERADKFYTNLPNLTLCS